MYSIRGLLRRALSSVCPLCGLGAHGGDLCGGCLQDVMPDPGGRGRCPRCGAQAPAQASAQSRPCLPCLTFPPAYAQTVVAIDYAFPGDMLVRALKERGRLDLAGLLGRLIWQAILARGDSLPALDVLVPVPSSRVSIQRRGFNPAAEIARQIGLEGGLPVRHDCLHRTRASPLQKTLGARQRQSSTQGLYAARPDLPPVRVGLVDDVMTSGSTLHAAALALRAQGVATVVALVGARTPNHAPIHTAGHTRLHVWQNDGHV